MLISPTEPNLIKHLGETSLKPEKHGVDAWWIAQRKPCGIQRKEIRDLFASVQDGRLQKELLQMNQLHHKMLIVENWPTFTDNGTVLENPQWTRTRLRGLLWSIRQHNIWVERTDHIGDTAKTIQDFHEWSKKTKHISTITRPGPNKDEWGNITSASWGKWFLQSIDGIGPGLADRIWEQYGLPFKLTVTENDLCLIDGISTKTANKIVETFQTNT